MWSSGHIDVPSARAAIIVANPNTVAVNAARMARFLVQSSLCMEVRSRTPVRVYSLPAGGEQSKQQLDSSPARPRRHERYADGVPRPRVPHERNATFRRHRKVAAPAGRERPRAGAAGAPHAPSEVRCARHDRPWTALAHSPRPWARGLRPRAILATRNPKKSYRRTVSRSNPFPVTVALLQRPVRSVHMPTLIRLTLSPVPRCPRPRPCHRAR